MGVSSNDPDQPMEYSMLEEEGYYHNYYYEDNGKQWYDTIKKLEAANFLFIEAAMKIMFPKLGTHHTINSLFEKSVLQWVKKLPQCLLDFGGGSGGEL